METIQRFLEKIAINEDCWEWTGGLTDKGYARFQHRSGHRFIFKYYHGEINKDLHHTCRNKQCVNPLHLKQVTPQEHGHIHIRTHCPQGHEYNENNTIHRKDGYKDCRICHALRCREWRVGRLLKTPF